jgi:hypothetical protein
LLYRYVKENIEPKGYFKKEFTRMIQHGNPLVLDALRNGVMVADDGFWREQGWKE